MGEGNGQGFLSGKNAVLIMTGNFPSKDRQGHSKQICKEEKCMMPSGGMN